jgi:hypothetical protein
MEPKDNDHCKEKRYMTKDLKVATWNVRGITHKEDELDKELKSRHQTVSKEMGRPPGTNG